MTVGNVGGIKDQAFIDFISKPQAYNAAAPQPQMGPAMQQPMQDEFAYQEPEKKGGFGKFLLGLVAAAAIIVGGNRLAHNQQWIKAAPENPTKFVEKYVQKPLNQLDDFTMKQWDSLKKVFKKDGGETKEKPKTEGPEKPPEGDGKKD